MKVTIEIQGHTTEVGMLLSQISEVCLGDGQAWAEDEGAWWTPENTDAFLDGLTDTAVHALGVIAKHSPKLSFTDLRREMGTNGSALAGKLSASVRCRIVVV